MSASARVAENDRHATSAGGPEPGAYWMRSTSLDKLRAMALALKRRGGRVSATELNAILRESLQSVNQKAGPPGPTTLYHYRRAAEKLGILRRAGRELGLNLGDEVVEAFLGSDEDAFGSPGILRAATCLLLRNDRLRELFFDLFVPRGMQYDVDTFAGLASPVAWRTFRENRRTRATLTALPSGPTWVLDSPVKVSSIIYGVRYWAKNELLMIDEYHAFGDEGGVEVMYPVDPPASTRHRAAALLLARLDSSAEWSTLSLRRLIADDCVPGRVSRVSLFEVIEHVKRRMPDGVVLQGAPPSLATLTARSRGQVALQLQNYMRYGAAYVSHVRIHATVGRLLNEEAG